jgi:hypothetical protein
MEKLVRILSIVALITLISVPSVLACLQVEGDGRYDLSLAAKQHFSTVILTAHLTRSEEHHERGRAFYDKEDVAGALIYFCTCNSHGGNRKEIGHSRTGRDGTATFCWSATHNGDYWFVAEYVSNTNEKHDGHS